jgi:hypothetical protein
MARDHLQRQDLSTDLSTKVVTAWRVFRTPRHAAERSAGSAREHEHPQKICQRSVNERRSRRMAGFCFALSHCRT